MTYSRTVSCLLTLLLGLAANPAFTQGSGDGLAEQLNSVRQQRRQLEQDIGQYETSIELLRSSGSSQSTMSPAVTALTAQLQRSRKRLLTLVDQEAEILDLLPPGGSDRQRPTVSDSSRLEAAEVTRLKNLLKDYYSQVSSEEAEAGNTEATASTTNLPAPAATVQYAKGRVKLNGPEGIRAIEDIDLRLEEDFSTSLRRQLDIIFHIEVRKDGTLLSSRSHNFKALGNSQYISKVSLTGGTAVILVRKDSWMVEVASESGLDYLITLSLAQGAAPELHVIPVDELKATQWTELPAWLPDIGVVATTPTS